MKAKVNVLAKPHPYIFCIQQYKIVHGSYLQGTHTYTTDAMHMLLDHTLLGHVGGGKWPRDDAKTMPLHMALYTCLWYNLNPVNCRLVIVNSNTHA